MSEMLCGSLRTVCGALIVTLVSSCSSVPGPLGRVPVCQECFDAVNAARLDHPAKGSSHNEVLRTYECPCCMTEMSVYIENGIHMVKCGACAVDGVRWDQCEPSSGIGAN